MNCAECKELLVAYLESLLEDSQKQAVEEHVKECETCRTELEGLQTLQQRLVGNGKALAQSDLEDEVMNRIIREQSARLKSAAQAGAGLRLRRLTMKSGIVKLAVAAAVVLAVGGGIFLWTGTKSGVALAEVLANVERVQAFMYKMTMHVKTNMEGTPASESNVDGSMLIANDYGMRMDMKTVLPALGQTMDQQMYMLPREKMMLVLMPALKKYMRMQANEEMLEKKRQENNDPRLMLKRILECQYTDLGKTVLNGIEVQGFQTTDPAYTNGLGEVDVKVWVDCKTELPVRVDMKIKMGEQVEVEGTLHDFEWEIPVSAAEFNPVIPADFTPAPGDGMKMPEMTEETALGGLKLCLEMNGKYPDDLNLGTLMQAAAKSFQDSAALEAAKSGKFKDVTAVIEEQSKKALEKMMPIQALGGFYITLKQEGKEPVYYGKIAKAGDIAQVLLRWKTGTNAYRVIFADLHAATVNADTLAKLEAGLPK